MFISYTRSFDRVILSPENLEGLMYLYATTRSSYTENLLSNLTYVGRKDSKTYDTWNTIVEAATGNSIEHSTTQIF